MPSYGKEQKPAGVDVSPVQDKLETRYMVSRNENIETALAISNCEYKGNVVLRANRG